MKQHRLISKILTPYNLFSVNPINIFQPFIDEYFNGRNRQVTNIQSLVMSMKVIRLTGIYNITNYNLEVSFLADFSDYIYDFNFGQIISAEERLAIRGLYKQFDSFYKKDILISLKEQYNREVMAGRIIIE